MPTYRLLGRVFPKVVHVSFMDVTINWGVGDLGFPLIMSSQIRDSALEVSCNLDWYEPRFLSTLYARGMNLVRGCLDLCTFATGLGLVVVLDTIHFPDGTSADINLQDTSLGALCTAFTIPPKGQEENDELADVLALVFKEPALLGALNDLGHIMAVHHQSPTNCGRVLDGLRKAIAPNEEPKRGWSMLRSALNLEQRYVEWVSDYAKNTRHGDRGHIPEQVVHEITQRTWRVMNRFLEYRKSGSQPLSLSDFPLLTSSNEPS